MGGNALKHCETRRYEAAEYFDLEARVLAQLKQDFPTRRIAAIPAYRSKPSFGDMDVLFEADNLQLQVADYLRDTFASKEVVQNSSVYSFEYASFQVDLLLTPAKNFQCSLNYFSYNDLGNLLGRIAHMMGLKLGHDGLCYNWRDGDYQFATLELERDWAKILPVLGYSYERWQQGFDTLEDIFRFTASSPFFNKDVFLLHNRNATSRRRDAKRKTYTDFLKWLEAAAPGTLPDYPKKPRKEDWLPYLFEQLPDFRPKFEETQARFERAMEAKRRFSGQRVRDITGLGDKDLGQLMQRIRGQFATNDALRAWVLSVDDAAVEALIRRTFEAYLKELHDAPEA